MIDLFAVASDLLGAVNPMVPAVIQVNSSFTKVSGGKVIPVYTSNDVTVDIQALSWTDLRQIDGLNLQGVLKKAYVQGYYSAVNRPKQEGGDLLVVNGDTWLIKQPLEEWTEGNNTDWCSLVIQLQVST